MIYKHLAVPHWDDWRIHQNIIYTKMERNINTKINQTDSDANLCKLWFEIIL